VQLLLACLGSKMAGDGSGSVIAFTSTNSGEGVSHVVRVLAGQLATQTGRPTLMVDAGSLGQLSPADLLKLPARCVPTNIANLWVLPKSQSPNGNGHKPLEPARDSRSDASCGVDVLRTLRAVFAHTLIDCPAIGASHEAAVLAPNVDGVVLVVEADRTKRDQILRVRQTIEMAQGELMALVLNKRRHVVPDWLYRML
jgi:Mrp family chromosome partitioning ATPase